MSDRPDARRLVFEDDFDGPDLDRTVWLPHYLPAWSSLAESAATYAVRDSCLYLTIPPEQGLWCAGDHSPPLRVSGVQSGNFSGPVGSTVGQQPYRQGVRVREEQETFWGWTPEYGYLEIRARGVVTPRAMVACWMVGLEDIPERSAEICLMEVFGNAVVPGVSAAVGMGLHPFRDPAVAEDFQAVRLPIDVTAFHTYAVDWTPDSAEIFIDGALVRRCAGPPTYPMQMMLAVFDFPSGPPGDEVPSLVVDWVRGYER
ncbi:glycoside hydrolase family 16 protein [Phytoactinopolyspora halotolerans]|uniref:Glycoside hydrolase family 16 protein n=1 Tax=Phytoactinopolyspora halotolerans TaxID=1981512 RepID=A0A6L9SG11_9ACTN|nr:glycoside hydrolase family 16 protein [Phytoactinopolyspora halotolerans]NEE03381.1 glycoside hydrolase family 16 protein [Phytoactinopolyspora halotolerans]